MEDSRVVIERGRFERFGSGCRVVMPGGGYWTVDRVDLVARTASAWCRIEGWRSGFSHLDVSMVRRLDDDVVVVSENPWWYSFEVVAMAGIALAGFLIAVVDSLDRMVR